MAASPDWDDSPAAAGSETASTARTKRDRALIGAPLGAGKRCNTGDGQRLFRHPRPSFTIMVSASSEWGYDHARDLENTRDGHCRRAHPRTRHRECVWDAARALWEVGDDQFQR